MLKKKKKGADCFDSSILTVVNGALLFFYLFIFYFPFFFFLFSAQSPAALDPLQQAYAGMQHYTG